MGNNARSNGGGVTPLVTLLLDPDTTSQTALRVTLAERTDLRDRAVLMARDTYGKTASLGWLDHQTQKVTKIVKHQPKPLVRRGRK